MIIEMRLDDSKWIDIKESIPEDKKLVYFKCRYMGFVYVTLGYLYNGQRGHSFWQENDIFFRSQILYWMDANMTQNAFIIGYEGD